MGEAEPKQEEVKVEEPKPEEKKEEEKKEEEKKEEEKPSPPQPTVLSVDLHCVGCAKKIERSILRCRGVEEVEVDMAQNHVIVKGIVDPQALCSRIQKKTMRDVKVVSPLPPAEADPTKPEAAPEPPGVPTVELHVNMHCEACAQQLRRKILKMRGVQAVETALSAKKVTVTGTMNPDKLVEYIHKRTGKLAKIIPPPPPPPQEEEKKEEEAEKPAEEKPPEEKPAEEKPAEAKEGDKAPEEPGKAEEKAEEPKKEGEGEAIPIPTEDLAKKMAYWYGGMINEYEEEIGKRMVPWMPVYVIERPPPPPPPPSLFSDENPNACCIT